MRFTERAPSAHRRLIQKLYSDSFFPGSIWNCRRAIVDLSVRSAHSVQAEASESPPGSLPMRLTSLSGKRANVEMGGQAYEERRSAEKEVQHLPICSHTSERNRFSVPHSPTLLSSLGPNHRDLSLCDNTH